MGIIGGGVAVLTKKVAGVDLRGRMMELAVLLSTLYLSFLAWGLVKAFFGDVSACHGALGSVSISANELGNFQVLSMFRKTVLLLAKRYYLFLDGLPRRINNARFQAVLCTDNDELSGIGCFENLPNANPEFFLQEMGGERCAADLMLVLWLSFFAGVTYVGTAVWKNQRRRRRPVRGEPRPHID
jgi:hypothetical protein